VGDFRTVFGIEAKRGAIVGDVDTEGQSTFRHPKNSEVSNTVALKATRLLNDVWQIGTAIPYVDKSRSIGQHESTSKGLGDVSVFGALEWLTEKEYSRWKPRGFASARLTFPTAPSVYDFKDELAADARGQGLYLIAAGVTFSKVLGAWDLMINPEIETGPEQKIATDSKSVTVRPGLSYLFSISTGWSPRQLSACRFGINLAPKYESPKLVNEKETTDKLVWNTGASAHYTIDSLHALGLVYSDQTLIGPAKNTTLERSISVTFETREAL
jgi:hypothetical protein